ncbi:GNAT family N-acetyltransferase [Ahniella affigens]|uniref:GNAT family N-acetyltransferase n=1 Tax=Ahniella affigens TaxID=2021234 RepID=UPI0011B1E3E4|nr:GNAT family N-acetyltransferase [Ahniella affigens]
MPTITLQTPGPDAASELAAFMRRCYVAAYGHVASAADTEAHLIDHYNDALIAEALADPTHCLIRSFDGVTPTGYAWLVQAAAPAPLHATHAVELRRFYLAPESIGGGSADVLMQGVLDQGRRWFARGVFLTTWKESERAVRFYGRHGFRALDHVSFRIGSKAFEDWLLWRGL